MVKEACDLFKECPTRITVENLVDSPYNNTAIAAYAMLKGTHCCNPNNYENCHAHKMTKG